MYSGIPASGLWPEFEPLPESDIHEIKSSCADSEVHTDAKQVCGTCGVKDRRFGSRERNANRCCRSKCANKKIPHDQNVVYQWEDTSVQCRSFLLCNACVQFLRERCDAALQPVLARAVTRALRPRVAVYAV